LAQNPKVLAFSFTEKRQFAVKLNKTPHFLVVKSIFQIDYTSKSKGVSLRVYQKRKFAAKTDRNFIFLGRNTQIPD
jgi:hypothetical protein